MRTAGIVAAAMLAGWGCRDGWGRDAWQRESPGAVFGSSLTETSPLFGATVTSATPPPPISGGTLVVGRDGVTAVAADPDRDAVYVVDLRTQALRGTVALDAGDEPGRVAEGPDGTFFVALRRGGALAVVDAATHALRARIAVCPAPRGLAFDAVDGVVHVACAGGELVTVRASDAAVVRTLHLAADLRDVAFDGGRVMVSRFRRAEVIAVDRNGSAAPYAAPRPIGTTDAGVPALPPDAATGDASAPPPSGREPSVAWRTVPSPRGGLVMVHQLAQRGVVDDNAHVRAVRGGSYGSGGGGFAECGPIVAAAVSRIVNGQVTTFTGTLLGAALPVDVAVSHSGERIVVVAAGNSTIPGAPLLYTVHEDAFRFVDNGGAGCGLDNEIMTQPNAQPVAAAFDGADALVVQTREPAALYLVDQHISIPLSDVSRQDTGHTIFHSNSGVGIACASCHPEGGEDGRVWNFAVAGQRRTQDLRGGLLATAPFHWAGEFADFAGLSAQIFHVRMSGPALSPEQTATLARWLDAMPALPRAAIADAAAVVRWQAVFNDATVGCARCHGGPLGTNNTTVAVGTGAALQVPRLVGLAYRAPYMHDGCAATLLDRFGACGGGDAHGVTSQLAPDQLSDLVAYLHSL